MSACERCKGSGIDPYYSQPGILPGYDSMGEPPVLEPCIDCQYENLPADGPCHCGAVLQRDCGPAACAWSGPEDCVWDHGQDTCWGTS